MATDWIFSPGQRRASPQEWRRQAGPVRLTHQEAAALADLRELHGRPRRQARPAPPEQPAEFGMAVLSLAQRRAKCLASEPGPHARVIACVGHEAPTAASQPVAGLRVGHLADRRRRSR